MVMDDELLSDILAAEREIRRRIDELEERVAHDLEQLRQELEQELVVESRTLEKERDESLRGAEEESRREAASLVESARAFARRLENLDDAELDTVLLRHLAQILPAGAR